MMIRIMKILVVNFLVVAFSYVSAAAKILLATSSVINTPSQYIVLSAVTEPLVERGHEVVLLAAQNKITKGLSKEAVTGEIYFESNRSKEEFQALISRVTGSLGRASKAKSKLELFRLFQENYASLTEGCIKLFKDKSTLERLKREKFNLIISLPLVGCDVLLAQYLDVPFVVVSPVRRSFVVTEDHFGIPIPSSYVPFSVFAAFSDRMSFTERLQNVFFRFVLHPVIEFVSTYPLRAVQREMEIRPDRSLSQLVGEARLWLSYTSFALDYPQPTAPNWVPIGGITAKPAKELPQDIKEFVDGSGEHGIIVFSLGSGVSALDNEPLNDMIAKVFSELPQRVLWKYKAEKRPRNLGNNTLISEWLPQNDLVGHPKTRLLIYHGGSAGTYEATSHGLPLLIMPLAADHMGNAARVVNKGFGRSIDKNTMTENEFREAILDIITDPKYKANAARASAIMGDTIVSPQELVVYWIEHVLEFGSDHLRLRSMDLNVIQNNSLDVIAFLLVVCFVFIVVMKWIITRCCCCMCRRKTKAKKD